MSGSSKQVEGKIQSTIATQSQLSADSSEEVHINSAVPRAETCKLDWSLAPNVGQEGSHQVGQGLIKTSDKVSMPIHRVLADIQPTLSAHWRGIMIAKIRANDLIETSVDFTGECLDSLVHGRVHHERDSRGAGNVPPFVSHYGPRLPGSQL